MWAVLLFTLPSVFGDIDLDLVTSACVPTVDMGKANCNKAASIRYHLDVETMTCLAFRFTGCGGNSNNFPTRSKCYETCMPMDYFNCPANRPEVKQADGSIIICNDKTNCPEGSQCDYGAFFGICCDKKDHENLEADYHPDCGGRKSVKADSGETLLGKSCDHHFCPDGAECHHGHFFAYCCQ